jgi:2,5-dihydroxypyridine 5,6-dioxygenase
MAITAAFLDAWKNVLDLSRVSAAESTVILIGAETHPDHVEAARLSLALLGARVLTMQLGERPRTLSGTGQGIYGPTALTGNQAAIAALKTCDVVIDLMGMYRGAEQEEILAAHTRILLVKEPPDIFMRLQPAMADKAKVTAAAAIIDRARTMSVRSAAGTDFSVRLGEYPILMQYGFADEPGRWDHCPSAFVARWPDERSANGTVVLDKGDTILPFMDYVRTPITLRIADGYIRGIEGDLDATFLRDYMAKFDDSEAYAISHLGWGLHERAHWTALGLSGGRTVGMDARSFAGNFMFSSGPNSEAGGNRHTACHLDIPMRNCSVLLDGRAVVIDGAVV